ncbi:MAG: L,D-transpeptidase [Proteobacteria bacterium]|nr:L,D-transpeptidase [Pseudomonadota bacterium]
MIGLLACGAPSEPVVVEVVEVAPPMQRVVIDRAGRELLVLSGDEVLRRAPVGIGRGGLGEKTAMSDLVTPTGTFTVDLVLHDGSEHDAVSDAVRPQLDLATVWSNMSGLDFDGDGAPDGAYGSIYVGLDGEQTGPKMRQHSSGTPYWYSIALHATPDPDNLGAANSGGCVHVDDALLLELVEDGVLGLERQVTIEDRPLRE